MAPRTLDLARFHGPERAEFSREAMEGFIEHGFIKIVGHGLSEETLAKVLAWNEAFFGLSMEEKLAISNVPGPHPQRGYQAVGVEKTATLNNSDGDVNFDLLSHEGREDIKETFDMGGVQDAEYPNVWPSDPTLPGFRSWMEEYYATCQGVALQLLSALELALGLSPNVLVGRTDGYRSEVRMNHYPATAVERLQSQNTMRIWPHTDAGALSLLFQDGNGGLEIEDRRRPGTFEPLVLADKAELIVNGGEALERWTNGRLVAGLHQVTTPAHLKQLTAATAPARRSVAFFLYPNPDASVAPVEHFADARQSKYGEMTFREYHRHRNAVAY